MEQHGTTGRYQRRRCRCKKCRRAWADYVAKYRRSRGVKSRDEAVAVRDAKATRRLVERAVQAEEDVNLPVTLTGLGGQILVEMQQRDGRKRGEILDDLLRQAASAAA